MIEIKVDEFVLPVIMIYRKNANGSDSEWMSNPARYVF